MKSEAEEKVQVGAVTLMKKDSGRSRVQHVLAGRWKRERKREHSVQGDLVVGE